MSSKEPDQVNRIDAEEIQRAVRSIFVEWYGLNRPVLCRGGTDVSPRLLSSICPKRMRSTPEVEGFPPLKIHC